MKRVVPDEPAKDRGRVIHVPEPWGPVTPTQAQAISWGWHPGSGRPLPEERDERTCGTCFHLTAERKYLKCDEGIKPATRGPATDLKKKWPACVAWLAIEDEETADLSDTPYLWERGCGHEECPHCSGAGWWQETESAHAYNCDCDTRQTTCPVPLPVQVACPCQGGCPEPDCPGRVTDPEAASAVMKVIEAAVLWKGRVEERLRYIGADPTQPNAYGDMQPLADAVAALARLAP